VFRAAKIIGKSWCSLLSDAKAKLRVPLKAFYTSARIKPSSQDNLIKRLYLDRANLALYFTLTNYFNSSSKLEVIIE
jgi:hypothetical protein